MSVEENKALVHSYMEETFNQGNIAVIEQIASTDFVYHHATGRDLSKEAYKQMSSMTQNAFPEVCMEIDDLFAEGDKVACRFTITCIHKGEYRGIPPTGKKITFQGVNIFRIVDGKIAEIWSRVDLLGMMQQLGVIPPMGKK